MKNSMYIQVLLATVFIFIGSANYVRASHVIASDVSYVAVDSFQYDITFRFYRECSGNSFDAPTRELFVRGEGDSSAIAISPKLRSIRKLPNPCDTAGGCYPSNTARTGPGIEEFVYIQRIDLSQKPYSALLKFCSIRFESRVCCRSTDVVNIATYDWVYAYAVLNRCVEPKHNSPTTVIPVQDYCINRPMYMDISADTEADSISYAVERPYTNYNYLIQYKSGLSMQHPMKVYDPTKKGIINHNANPPIGFYFDSVQGRIICTPEYYGQYLVSTKVIEWMKDSSGKMIISAVTYKPYVVWVRNCSGNNMPKLSAPFSYNVCAGRELCTEIQSLDYGYKPAPPLPPIPSDSVKLTWKSDISNASFTIVSDTAKHQALKFCWTPEDTDARQNPYTFTVTAWDDGCPFPLKVSHTYDIYVREDIEVTTSIRDLGCGTFELKGIVDSSLSKAVVYGWQILDSVGRVITQPFAQPRYQSKNFPGLKANDTATFRYDGTYIVSLRVSRPGSCQIWIYDTIVVTGSLPMLVPTDATLCCPNTLNLRNLEHDSSAGKKWFCTLDPSVVLGDTLFKPTPACSNTERRFMLTYENTDSASLCVISDSFEVRLRPKIPVAMSDLNICIDSGRIDPMDEGMTDSFDWKSYRYRWECFGCADSIWERMYGEDTSGPFLNVLKEYQDLDTNTYKEFLLSLELTDSFGCVATERASLRLLGQPRIDRTLFDTHLPYSLCSSDSGLLLQNHNYPSEWLLNDTIAVQNNTLGTDSIEHGTYKLKLKSGKYCQSDSLSFVLHKSLEIDYLPRDTSMISRKNHVETISIQEGYSDSIRWMADSSHWLAGNEGERMQVSFPYVQGTSNALDAHIWVATKEVERCTTNTDTIVFHLRPDPCYEIKWDYYYSGPPDNTNFRFWVDNYNPINIHEWKLYNGARSTNQYFLYFIPDSVQKIWVSHFAWTNLGDSCTTELLIKLGGFEEVHSSFNIYPNPVKNLLTVNLAGSDISHRYMVYNVLGQPVMNGKFKNSSIDCSNLIPGMYVLKLILAEGEFRQTFLKE